uniref:Uncharacterized protein n=1 Tax=Branchiostoma floridae TaxID=7739 RepID=C3YQC7_BRAFL|eukprot:XP_002601445.1 hypothetical protein BRAFLDRAFT_104394 [Branchiostoma floridae]
MSEGNQQSQAKTGGTTPQQQPQTDWRSIAHAAANIPNTMYVSRAAPMQRVSRRGPTQLRRALHRVGHCIGHRIGHCIASVTASHRSLHRIGRCIASGLSLCRGLSPYLGD